MNEVNHLHLHNKCKEFRGYATPTRKNDPSRDAKKNTKKCKNFIARLKLEKIQRTYNYV